MVVASEAGERIVRFPEPMIPVEGETAKKEHRLSMEFGEVRVFVGKT